MLPFEDLVHEDEVNDQQDMAEMTATARKFVEKNKSVMLSAVAVVTQRKVAESMGGHDVSYVNRFLNENQKISFDELLALLDVCELVLYRMTEKHVVVPIREYDSLAFFASEHAKKL